MWHSPSVIPLENPFDVMPSPGSVVEPNPSHPNASHLQQSSVLPVHNTPTPQQPRFVRTVSFAAEAPEAPRKTFLIVDDNSINRTILESYLKKLGHPFVSATNGKEAYDTYIESPGQFRCVFMDISMPVMDGFEASRLIRKFERGHQLDSVLLFALTGLASADAQQEALASGIDLFLTKPVRLKELSIILAQHGMS